MAKSKTVYKASDGSEHATEDAADRRSVLVEAQRQFESAAKAVSRSLGATAMTADGEPFEMGGWASYWYVSPGWGGMPQLLQKRCYSFDAEVRLDHREECLILRCLEGEGSRREYRDYEINTLYKSEQKAREALVKACDEWLAEQTAQIAEIKSKR